MSTPTVETQPSVTTHEEKKSVLPSGYVEPKASDTLKKIPSASLEVERLRLDTSENLDRFGDALRFKEEVRARFGRQEGFDRGATVLGNPENCTKDQYEAIKAVLRSADGDAALQGRLDLFFDVNGFFPDKETVRNFLSDFKQEVLKANKAGKDAGNVRKEDQKITEKEGNVRKEEGNVRKEDQKITEKEGNVRKEEGNVRKEDQKITEKEGNVRKEDQKITEKEGNVRKEEGNGEKDKERHRKQKRSVEKLTENQTAREIFQQILERNGIPDLEAFHECSEPERKRIAKEFMLEIKKRSKKEKDPKKRKELEETFQTLSREFIESGLISDWEIAAISHESVSLMTVDAENPARSDVTRFEGFDRMTDGNSFLKRLDGANDVIVFENGKPVERIASSVTGYEIIIDESIPLMRDTSMLSTKIRETETKIEMNDTNLRRLGNLLKEKRDAHEAKPSPKLKAMVEEIESTIKKLEDIGKTLEERLAKFEERKRFYEGQILRNGSKVEHVTHLKEIALKRIRIFDESGITQILPQEAVDQIWGEMTRKGSEVRLNDTAFDENLSESALNMYMKTLMIHLLGRSEQELYGGGGNFETQMTTKMVMDELAKDPAVFDGGKFRPEGLRKRLATDPASKSEAKT